METKSAWNDTQNLTNNSRYLAQGLVQLCQTNAHQGFTLNKTQWWETIVFCNARAKGPFAFSLYTVQTVGLQLKVHLLMLMTDASLNHLNVHKNMHAPWSGLQCLQWNVMFCDVFIQINNLNFNSWLAKYKSILMWATYLNLSIF